MRSCPKLDLKEGEHSRWRCEGVNPYKEDIPADIACHTSYVDQHMGSKLLKSYLFPGALHGETKLEASSLPSPLANLMAPGVIQPLSLLVLSTSLQP